MKVFQKLRPIKRCGYCNQLPEIRQFSRDLSSENKIGIVYACEIFCACVKDNEHLGTLISVLHKDRNGCRHIRMFGRNLSMATNMAFHYWNSKTW